MTETDLEGIKESVEPFSKILFKVEDQMKIKLRESQAMVILQDQLMLKQTYQWKVIKKIQSDILK
jgi:hypothetical protein